MFLTSTWEFIQSIFLVAGGLGLFLYGMKMMSDGLENLAGLRMRSILERATSNRFMGIFVGALITVIIQSSTATTVMTVGFVNAGMMSLVQAISLSMGANIGTTLSALIILFKFDAIASLFIFAGFLLYLMPKKKAAKDLGFIVLSIGILFFELTSMSGPLKEFAGNPGYSPPSCRARRRPRASSSPCTSAALIWTSRAPPLSSASTRAPASPR